MAKPRFLVIIKGEVAVYHTWTRITRRRHLFGLDAFTGKNYDYRKDWVRKEFRRLAKEMAIQVFDYAVLSNHLHNVLCNRPDIVASWSDIEVARRWWRICPDRRRPNGKPAIPTKKEINRLLGMVDELRERLSSISWMMRLALQRIAQRANKEDGVDGRFFAGRFKCERLTDEVSVLNCSLYVDLNWIHAGMAKIPEESYYTSAFERIRSQWQEKAKLMSGVVLEEGDNFDGDWLAPIFHDERAEAYVSSKDVPPERSLEEADTTPLPPIEFHEDGEAKETTIYNPLGSSRISNRGFLPMKLKEYLQLLDFVGRRVRKDKRGAIPKSLPPILNRLGLDAKNWLDGMVKRFQDEPNLMHLPSP